jgi:hypothetical protein
MKRMAVFLILSLIMTVAVMAQDKPKTDAPGSNAKPAASSAALPAADEILDKFVTASGGKEAMEKLKSRTVKGTFEIEAMNINGPFESFSKAPNKNAVITSVPNMGNFINIFDGTKGWDSNPMTGLRELSGAELAASKRDADFYLPINFRKNYPKMEVKGKEKVSQSEAYVVEATPAEGGPEKFYFDVASGLLVRQDAERESPQGKIAVEIYYEDYKAVDGVKIAHLMKQVTPMYALTIKFAEVKHNIEIDDAKFNKPSSD